MKIENSDLKKILVDSGVVNDSQYTLFEKSAKAEGKELYDYVIENNVIKEEQLGQLISRHIKIPFVSLYEVNIPDDVLRIIPELVARKQKLVVFSIDDKGTHIATNDPGNELALSMLKRKFGNKVILHYATSKAIKDALSMYSKDATKAFEYILSESIQQAKGAVGKHKEVPIIKMVETIIEYAYNNKASDVHIEPTEKYSLLRFRIDGLLHDIVRFPAVIHPEVITRIKVLANLRTDEHQAPLDGKIEYNVDDENLSLRVSVVPTIYGEKVVLRLLSDQAKRLSLSDLGFFDQALEKIIKAYNKPYGMILTTGPTGSGKTTTLYAIVKILNTRDVNITTIEDPVEYTIENISQIQINPKTNLTFATGLRSIVRQDPDIILVGEIRDAETAKIAVNSAMTGHLVLSTLHTNDAATSIPRLFDMGVEPFLVASSVNVIVGQRLVRKICEHCRISQEITPDQLKQYKTHLSEALMTKHFGKTTKKIRVYVGKGCDICHHTGHLGRIGIYEVLEVDEDIRRAIVKKENADEINKMAVSKGMLNMIDDGLEKVKMGLTTIDEIIRATKE